MGSELRCKSENSCLTALPGGNETFNWLKDKGKMSTVLLRNPYSSCKPKVIDATAFERKLPEVYQRSKSLYYPDSFKLEKRTSPDEIDNPLKENLSFEDKALFETMKLELNRLNSFTNKWPVDYVKPADLAQNGFFYLQSEDKVQCAFCYVIIDDWNVGHKPLRQHMKKSPRCPYLLCHYAVGNVPIVLPQKISRVSAVSSDFQVNSTPCRPKSTRMAPLKKRLETYKDWPIIALSTQQLAECGLFYTGSGDIVECFFCGGKIGNWELNDDPWVEHAKFYPNCGYVNLVKKHSGNRMQRQNSAPVPQTQVLSLPVTLQYRPNLSTSLRNEIINEACNIFEKSTVEKVVLKHLRETACHFNSLEELCGAVLEYLERENPSRISQDVTGHTSVEQTKCELNTDVVYSDPGNFIGASSHTNEESHTNNIKPNKDVFLCKICMDQQMSIAFQPCGHVVTCPKCAQVIFTCPLCRSPVTSKVKIYLS